MFNISLYNIYITSDLFVGSTNLYRTLQLNSPHRTSINNIELNQNSSFGGKLVLLLAIPDTIKTRADLCNLYNIDNDDILDSLFVTNITKQRSLYIFFKSSIICDHFYELCHTLPFSNNNNEICYCLYLSNLKVHLPNDIILTFNNNSIASFASIFTNYMPSINPYSPKLISDDTSFELPICPNCLLKLDTSVTAIVGTIDILKWETIDCKVCKSIVTKCEECEFTEDLWICLICGFTGCSRYTKGHANIHCISSNHCFVMGETGMIWNYQKDAFVHRVNTHAIDDLETIVKSYNRMLNSQLSQQCNYFENKFQEDDDYFKSKVNDSNAEIGMLSLKLEQVFKELEDTKNDLSIVNSKFVNSKSKLVLLQEESTFLRDINNSLLSHQSVNCSETYSKLNLKLKKTIADKDRIISDLESKLNDAMKKLE